MIKLKLPINKRADSSLLGVFVGEGEMAVTALDASAKAKKSRVARTASIQWAPEDNLKSMGERLKDLLASCGIRQNRISLSISGQDAFVRRYELPILPKKEWHTAARFEARKYMPFEISDLQCQTMIQKTEDGKKLEVVFTAVRKDALKSMIEDFNAAGFKVVWAEPVFISLLRLFLYSATQNSGEIRAFIEIGKNGSLHTVFEKKGVPLAAQRASVTTFSVDGTMDDEAYLSEIQLAFDSFNKSFRGQIVESVSFLRAESGQLLEKIGSELNVASHKCDLTEFGLNSASDDGPVYRAAGAALAGTQIGKYKFSNLLTQQKDNAVKKSLNILAVPNLSPAKERTLLIRIAAIECAVVLVIMLLASGLCFAKQVSMKHGIKNAKTTLAALNPKLTKKSVSELKKIKKTQETELMNRKKLSKTRDYLTPKLNLIAEATPESVQLSQVSYLHSEAVTTVTIAGNIAKTTLQQGVTVINGFVAKLQEDINGDKPFETVQIKSINEVKQTGEQTGIVFVITTVNKAE